MDAAANLATISEAAWHSLPADEVVNRLGSDLQKGLDPGEAEGRLARHGPNVLPERYSKPGTSDLRATVKAGANEVNLDLKK